MPIHEVAARGFGDAAAAYEEGRPTYPPAALTWLIEHLGLVAGTRVCDLGAGTGKLTRLLEPTGGDLVAVEPLAGMRAVLATSCPDVALVGATAEALPLRDGALDVVVAAQAFHWFDTDASLAELARVLRSGGSVALIWNAWDDTQPWVAQMHRVVANAGSTRAWQRGHFSRAWVGDALTEHPAFGAVTSIRFPHGQTLSRDGVVDRVATTSHVVAAEPAVRDATLDAVRAILDADAATTGRETVEFPYVTEIYASVRR